MGIFGLIAFIALIYVNMNQLPVKADYFCGLIFSIFAFLGLGGLGMISLTDYLRGVSPPKQYKIFEHGIVRSNSDKESFMPFAEIKNVKRSVRKGRISLSIEIRDNDHWYFSSYDKGFIDFIHISILEYQKRNEYEILPWD
jgi:hypothetical protein